MTEFFIIGERFVAITRQAAACCWSALLAANYEWQVVFC
jgi:hypothetical protein